MDEIYLTESDDLVTAQKKIEGSEMGSITLVIPGQSLLSAPVNLKLLLREVSKTGKDLKLRSDDPAVQRVIDSMPEKVLSTASTGSSTSGVFVTGQDVAHYASPAKAPQAIDSPSRLSKIPLLAGLLDSFRVFGTRVSQVVGFGRVFTFSVALLGFMIALGVLYFLFVHSHRAKIVLMVKPEGVIKSFEISASPGLDQVDGANRNIPGIVHEFVESATEATKATGTDIVGEKAVGKVTVYNKTDEAREFPKGAKLTLVRTDGEELIYYLNDSARVNKREATTTESSPGEFVVKYVSGRVEVDITASQISDAYNVNAGGTYGVEDLPVASFIAENIVNTNITKAHRIPKAKPNALGLIFISIKTKRPFYIFYQKKQTSAYTEVQEA